MHGSPPFNTARDGAPWWVYPCAAAFLGYFALLLTCDLVRPAAEGLDLAAVRGTTGLVVRAVEPGSPGARAGIRAGDVIVSADGQRLVSRIDWEGIQATMRFGRSVVLGIVRPGATWQAELAVAPAGSAYWLEREGVELLVTRAVQLVSLLLGLVVVFRRPYDFGARLGGWLLVTIGVLCITFPYRLADAWGGVPPLLGAALWLPFSSSLALPALLLSFFLAFPRPILRSPVAWVALWVPALAIVWSHLSFFVPAVYRSAEARELVWWFEWRWVVWIAYLGTAAVAAVVGYRRADATERRRIGVMLLGGGAGAAAGGPIALAYWRGSETGLFVSPVIAVGTLLLLAVPLSFAYAVLRHRLFDVRFIIRQGVRYALARRLLISIVPAALVGLAADVYFNRDRAVAELFVLRAPVYLGVAGGALLAQWRRQRWLDALDRRFFRERYDAERLLRGVVEDLHRAGSFDEAAGRVVAAVGRALHPTFAAVLLRRPGADHYTRLAGEPAGGGPSQFPASAKVLAMARALGKPLDISSSAGAWLAGRLPRDEAETLAGLGIELVVPIESAAGDTDAMLVLGARRSDEPYALEEQELLGTIGRSLAVLGPGVRPSEARATLQECPRCGACYDTGTQACEADGGPLADVRLPRTLSGRYRLERRLGRGGMGVVYGATDLSLGRAVAVKVLREELVGDAESADRFASEARISARFTHPHVVTIHDFGILPGSRAFLVMERLDGTTLRHELARTGRLDDARVLAVMRGVCSAVESAHRRSLVHRDLKPENVFLACSDGIETPKVLDFGIAKLLSDDEAGTRRETRAGVLLGTPEYMAPEQLGGGAPDPSWDVWALAVMTCEMLTGSHPFAGPAFRRAAGTAPSARPGSRWEAEADAAWRPYLARWLSIEPGARPVSAADFFSELQQMLKAG